MHLGIKNFMGVKKFLFGDGSYSGNITGSGVTVSGNTVTITGAATVAPDETTGAAVVVCDTLTLDGASASLSPSTNCKGLIIFAKTKIELKNGAKLNIDKKGKAGNFGNLTILDLVPQSINRKLNPTLASYVVLGEGAAGAPSRSLTGTSSYNGVTGSSATTMQSGGGGEGGTRLGGLTLPSSRGGRGGPCCGGGGGGGLLSVTAGYSGTVTPDYGPGGDAVLDPADAAYNAMGGAGDPIGASVGSVGANALSTGAGGGLLMLFSPSVSIASGCIVSSDGGNGAGSSAVGGTGAGSAGGGIICIVTNAGGYNNNGTVRANGGTSAAASYGTGGSGGAGSVNTFTVS